jgi:PhzF family phenazine biosynthesis protein
MPGEPDRKEDPMPTPLWIVDAFTDRPFAGNPAAVCLLGRSASPSDDWMQRLAMEMNLSETAFLTPLDDGFSLRWFTPAVEVDLCGHATLAGAHALWEQGALPGNQPARFHTRSGLLTALRETDRIRLDFPAKPLAECPAPDGLLPALGVRPVFVGRNEFDYLVEVESDQEVRQARPDVAALGRVACRGVILTARGAADFDFVSRFFAPASGVAEDPVTGSAHCALGPFWGPRLGKKEMLGFQASARGGVVGVRLAGDRVHLLGRAVTVLRGELAG